MKEKRRFLRLLSVPILLCAGLLAASPAAHGANVTFASAVSYTAGTNPYGVAVQDFNGDGKQDLVVANEASANMSFLPGNGDGTFGTAVNYPVGSHPRDITVADLNGDGKPDVVTANYGSNDVSVLLGNGDGTFQPAVNFAISSAPGYGTSGPGFVAADDLNGDGKIDLAIADSGDASVSVLLNSTTSPLSPLSFQPAVHYSYSGFYSLQKLALGDFNGDGKTDIVVADFGNILGGTNGGIYLLTNAGSGTFTGPTLLYATRGTAVRAADFNGDGKLDIASADYPGTVATAFGNGDGTFSNINSYPAGNQPQSLTTADFDGDGTLDIAATDFNNNASVFLNNGNGTFGTVNSFPTGTDPRTIAVGDFNGDGKPDLVTANDGSSNLSVLINTTVPVDPSIVTKTTDDGSVGTLRNAINYANAHPGATITFNISGTGVQTIAPTTALPAITASGTFIKGYSQPGAHENTLAVNVPGDDAVILVELNGANITGSANGLTLMGSNSTVSGLAINGFSHAGIEITGGANNNAVQGCFIGVDAAGTTAKPNGAGVDINGASSSNTIGDAGPNHRNVISGNTGDGVIIFDNGSISNAVLANYIGVDKNSTTALGNGRDGIRILGTSSNRLGALSIGAAPSGGNIIAANGGNGITLSGAGATGNIVENNYIGTNFSTTANLGNSVYGISLEQGASNNFIGNGGDITRGNIVAFSGSDGVHVVDTTSTGNAIRLNGIYSNGGLGINLDANNSADNVTPNDPRDTDTGPNNLQNFPVITSFGTSGGSSESGALNSTPNTSFTIDIYQSDLPNASGFGEGQAYVASGSVTTDASGNGTFTISNTALSKPYITATATSLSGDTSEFSQVNPLNYVVTNTNDSGTGSLRAAINFANLNPGSAISFAIPGTGVHPITPASALPVITAANTTIDGYTQPGSSANTAAAGDNAVLLIELNGTNAGAATGGLQITGNNCTVRGLIINHFGGSTSGDAITLNGASNCAITGNFIGTDSSGTVAAGNYRGVFLFGSATNNTIGGTTAAARNIISGNRHVGVDIFGSAGNNVQNNYIGTDKNGTAALGNSDNGVLINAASNNLIGVNAGNLISANGQGITIGTNGNTGTATGNLIQSNLIGTDVTGAVALPNHASGVLIIEGAQNNTVGDRSNSNLKNIVAFNAGDGVLLRDNNTTGNTVRFNSIFSNGGLGINLVGGNEDNNGVTANDAKDGDTGPNNLQNYPVITSTSTSGGSAIFGSLNSTPNTTVAIDIYFNSVADPAGYGEGQTFEGSQNVITDANGNATFNISTTNVTGFYPVAMATNLTTGDSSEFGPALADNIVTNTNDSGTGSLRNAINFANSNPGTTIRFGIPITDGGYNATTGAFTIQPATPLPTIIKDGTIIDGTTQGASFGDTNANGPEIVIDGTSAGAGAKGLTITAANCVVRGLTIDNFTGSLSSGQSPDKDAAAIYIFGGNNNRVEGCYIGTDATGTAAASAQAINGIVLENNGIAQARFNTIGGSTTAGAGNLISGNANIGVLCFTGTNGNSIVGNLIGTDRTGTTRVLNGEGVRLDGSHDNSIGGQTAEAQNVISGNGSSGIFIVHSGADSNVIQGNIIGLDINGANAINSGGGTGISVLQGPVNNRIGGTAVGAGNTISGNFFGVFISDAATGGTVIEGNLIGTDINGTLAKGNAYGVYLSNTANTTTIGIDEGGSNVIAGNTNDGIQISNSSGVTVQSNLIGVDSSGSVALANAGSGVSITGTSSGNFIGVPGGGNVISGNKQQDVLLSGSDVAGNLVQGNLIGTNAQDTAAIPSLIGVVLDSGAHDNTVGGTAQNAGNVISGHTTPPTVAGHFDNGININGANNNTVQGNFIGTNRSGSTAIKNSNIGIHIFGGSTGNLIGGTASGAGNVISGNANRGLTITDLGTTGNTVQGNIVGLDSTATTALHYDNTNGTPSNGVGLEVSSKATNNLIGGTVAGARNIVSGNGIGISISSTGTDGNKIQGNYVGPDQAGTGAPYPSQSGIFVSFGATNTTIGGTASGAGNLISGNSTALFISDSTTTGTVVQGNSIGTNAAGTGALANSSGILIAGGSGTTIGGTASGASNLIAFNADDGINVSGTATATIRGNSISSNAGLGINLEPGGETANTVTPNDVGDADTGPNGLQNYPVVSSVTTSGGTTTIAGTLNSLANTPFTLDFYSSDAADASGFGEGKVYLGSQDVTTDGSGNATFSFDINPLQVEGAVHVAGSTNGLFYTATATNKTTGETSEFAQNKTADAATLSLSLSPNTFSEGAGANAAVGTLTRNSSGAAVTVNLSSNNSRVSVPATVTIPSGATSVTFSVAAVDNAVADGPATVIITASATGLPNATANVTVTDNDSPGITVTPTSGLVTTEAGGQAKFTLVLNTQPTANVTIGLSSSNTGEGTVAPATLTFTPTNWNVPQTVTVTGVDDAIADGNQAYTIITAPASSSDANYNKLDAADVNVVNQDNDVATLTLSANPGSVVEGTATTVTLTRNTPVGAPLNVTISSSDSSTLPVPGAVTIPAGQSSVTFTVTAVDDNVVNGTRTINLTASQQGFTSGTTTVTVTDNDVATGPTPTPGPIVTPMPPPTLSVTLSPATVSEAAGLSAAHGTVTRQNVPTTAPVTVQITSDKTDKARPAITTVTIPAEATSTTFAIDAVDNTIVDGSQPVTFTATASGFVPGTATLTVTDNDKPTLTVSITPSRFGENGGARAAQGTVTRNTATDQPLVVQLSSSNTARARVPTSVRIPAGSTSANFTVAAINDNQPNGPRAVTIAARALGFVSGTAQVVVTDAAPASNLSFNGQVMVVPSNVAPGATTGIGGATVTLSQKGVVFDVVQTNAAGQYQFTNLPVGSYVVTVQKDGYASFSPASRTVVLSPKGAPRGNDFVGTPRGSLAGRITQRLEDGTVQGLSGVTVNAYSAQGIITGRTGSTGQFALPTAYVSKWIVLPVQHGTYFKPSTRVAVLSPTIPVLNGLDFSVAGTDTTNPTVNVLTPRAGSFTTSNQPTRITGTAADKGGAGVAVVTVALARFASATAKVPVGFWSWKTNSFITADNPLLVEHLATGTSSWLLTGLPKLPAGFYGVRATAVDGAGNKIASSFVRYSVTGSSTVVAETGGADTPSKVALSDAVAQAATDSVQLRFLGALDSDTASDAAHYTVEVNGHSATVESAGYNATTHTVVLALAEGSLRPGDRIVAHWNGVLDATGHPLAGQVGPVTVR